ncbi:MAG: response regulator, partial [Desulfobacterales bacterium]
DWKMPGMDGLEAARQIKKRTTADRMPKIIMATAYGRQEVMQQAKAVGLDGFLIKPVNPSVMLNTIMEVFGKELQRGPRVQIGQKPAEDAAKDLNGAKILLAEDNEINQQVALEILSGAGIQVALANNGQEAVEAVRQQEFDVVLMDIQMPVMDGYDATREIRNLKSEIRNVPIIAMTAHAMAGDREKSLAAGMNDHVAKPIDPQELFTTLEKWIRPAAKRETGELSETEVSDAAPTDVSDGVPSRVESNDRKDGLPQSLPGFDLLEGLKRLQGNRKLYRKLLLDFAVKYTETADQIYQALASKDMDRVHSLVHNVKGLAGNLSATRLQAAAAEMDSLVKKAMSGEDRQFDRMEEKFTVLKNALNEALSACRSIQEPTGEEITAPSAAAIPSIPPALAKQTAERLRNAVGMGNVTELKTIAAGLESDQYGNLSRKILQLAQDFDFDGISKLAEELESNANRRTAE